jgi:hypothetical protein
LPVRLDGTTIPGIPETIGYIDLRRSSIGEIADLVQQKLGRSNVRSVRRPSRVRKISVAKADARIPLPRIRRDFTQREKDKFLRETFTVIKQYSRKGLAPLKKGYQGIETDFLEVNNIKFTYKRVHPD